MKQYYEFLGIVSGALAETEVEPVIKKITDFFIGEGAEIAYKDFLGRKRFAFPIKHMRHGYYLVVNFETDKSSLKEIEKKLKLDEDVLRYMIIKSAPKTREEREKEKNKLQTKTQESSKTKTKEANSDKSTASKVSLDELDKKLDEILDDKI